MTKTFLTIALAAATLPLAFAAPQASTPAPSTNQATTQQPKKHVKKSHKAAKKTANNAAPAKPASK